MTIKQQTLRTAVMKALSDALADAMKSERADLFDALVDFHEATGAKSLDVSLPDGTKVATVALTVSTGGPRVADSAAFTAYVADRYPQAIYVPPATAVVSQQWTEQLFAEGRVDGSDLYDPRTGEVVPGVEVSEGGKPKTFSVRFESKKLDGRAAIASAWVDGQLTDSLPDFVSPALPDGDAA